MTDLAQLRDRVARVPSRVLAPSPALTARLDESLRYLASEAAERSLARDIYWPKWDSPWWHMLLAFELGEARRIPEPIVRRMVAALNAAPVKIFVLRPEDAPAGLGTDYPDFCHCQLGTMHQVLAAAGVDVQRELPWFSDWYIRYQMADGGLNCDSDAYLVSAECPSSMVGSISPLEAILLTELTPERVQFADRAAAFLIERRLMLGSHTQHNAKEREREPLWLQPCFPRFYLYDVLRGLNALLAWAERRNAEIPGNAVELVVDHLLRAFPDGIIRLQRHSYAGVRTRERDAHGNWERGPASHFALLDESSRIGDPSPTLTAHWSTARQALLKLFDEQRIAD